MWFVEEIAQCLDHGGTDTVDRREFRQRHGIAAMGLLRGIPQRRQGGEPFEQIARSDGSDMADTKAEQEPRGVRLALRLDSCEQVIDRLVLPAFALKNGITAAAQAEDICRAFQPAERKELVDGLLAQPFDIERGAADKMLEPLGTLRRADQPAGAAHIDFAFFGNGFAVALRAMIREGVSGADFVAGQVFDHLRDDVTGTLQHDTVADTKAEAADFIAVVQRDVLHHDPANGDWLEPTDRCELAGTADLNVDRLQRGLGAFRRELVRHPPARRLGDKAQPPLPVEPVNLINYAVDVIG